MKCLLWVLHLHQEKALRRGIKIAWICFFPSLPVTVPLPPLHLTVWNVWYHGIFCIKRELEWWKHRLLDKVVFLLVLPFFPIKTLSLISVISMLCGFSDTEFPCLRLVIVSFFLPAHCKVFFLTYNWKFLSCGLESIMARNALEMKYLTVLSLPFKDTISYVPKKRKQ